MASLTPWEIGILKCAFHRLDVDHKGYLSREDVRRIAIALKLDASSDALFDELDTEHDGCVQLHELLSFYSRSANRDKLQLEAIALSDTSALYAGGALGLAHALKWKVVVFFGAFFYDPLRLFRSTYVDWHTSLAAAGVVGERSGGGGGMAKEGAGLSTLLRHLRRPLATAGWLLHAIVLDATVGAALFVGYARARRAVLAASPPTAHAEALADAVGGAVGGGVSGALRGPCRALASRRCLPHRPGGFAAIRAGLREGGGAAVVARAAVAHAAFFVAFGEATRRARDVDPPWKWRPTVHTAVVTTVCGAMAGAVYQAVNVPLKNALARPPVRPLWSGFGKSVVYNVPVAAAGFLAFEYWLVNL